MDTVPPITPKGALGLALRAKTGAEVAHAAVLAAQHQFRTLTSHIAQGDGHLNEDMQWTPSFDTGDAHLDEALYDGASLLMHMGAEPEDLGLTRVEDY